MQRRRIVDSVAEIADHMTTCLQVADAPFFLVWIDPATKIGTFDNRLFIPWACCSIAAP